MAKKKQVETHTHKSATRKNIPSAEHQSVVDEETKSPIRVAIARRNPDLDPQLVWRGKDTQNWSELVVDAPPLYIQERIHPKHLIDDLQQQTEARKEEEEEQLDLFADFNGLPDEEAKTEFYQHDAHWSNRMILGDSLQVMASLAEREGLRGKVQCIYFDPPYGIKFNSNFQWSTENKDVRDGKVEHITREPEQVKAFRDTWQDGINSYLNYLRDRLSVAKDLLGNQGSIFVQIGDENVHRIRLILDEVFGEDNFVVSIPFTKKGNQKGKLLESISDNILWYGKNKDSLKFRSLFKKSTETDELDRDYNRIVYDFTDYTIAEFSKKYSNGTKLTPNDIIEKYPEAKLYTSSDLTVGGFRTNQSQLYNYRGHPRNPGLKKNRCWMHTSRPTGGSKYSGLDRLNFADRIIETQNGSIRRKVFLSDSGLTKLTNWWSDTSGAKKPRYIVETNTEVIKRCILMASDPGDLVLDPTCGSGTTAYVAEQWGRRWITIDTSRVALALARTRIMGSKYPYYYLRDSKHGQVKEAKISGSTFTTKATFNNIKHGFVYERAPHITSSLVANNAEIDVIYDNFQEKLEPLRQQLNEAMGTNWEEWEIPRELDKGAPETAQKAHAAWWKQRIARQKEIDASIAAKADFEYLYDKPYEDKSKIRVAGPFTVESLSPHRMLGVDEEGEPFDQLAAEDPETYGEAHDFAQLILQNLEKAGVQQKDKEDRIQFDTLTPWPGHFINAEGRYTESDGTSRRAGIFIGPEYGSVSRTDLVEAAREAGDAGFDLLIACAFNYDAHSAEFSKLGRIPVLKARMNADLHMAGDLAATGAGNLFVVFGEPDIDLLQTEDGQLQVQVKGVDIFDPKTGKVRSDDTDGIACWFVDTNYNGEMFFVRHAYFLGANDPYDSLKRSLKAEIDEEAWESLYGDTSRPFDKPETGRIAVKIINHLGDEVMKVMRVE